jgi:hypothetical protein
MAEAIWTTGKLIPVYQPVGRRANGEQRYRRAPFDLLMWADQAGGDEVLWINTLGFGSIDSSQVDLVTNAHEVGHEFGFYYPGAVIVEPHEGSLDNDTWQSVQSFGYI